jgi:uncharacterized membrane protein (DUF485 family)
VPQLDELSENEQKELLGRLMRRQAGLSIKVACGFIVLLIALPLINLYKPGLAARGVGGFTLTWLLLGVLFYPLTWILSGYFVKRSDRIEEELTRQETE